MRVGAGVVALLVLVSSCQREIAPEERDRLLMLAYEDLYADDEERVIAAIRTIGTYPTHEAVRKLMNLWKGSVSPKVEKELLRALKNDEEFLLSDDFVMEVFQDAYKPQMTEEQKSKLARLLHSTRAPVKHKLLGVLEMGK